MQNFSEFLQVEKPNSNPIQSEEKISMVMEQKNKKKKKITQNIK
jgi:hypothetical protein